MPTSALRRRITAARRFKPELDVPDKPYNKQPRITVVFPVIDRSGTGTPKE